MVYHPELVKVFYCNPVVKNDTITSSAKGMPIILTVQQLGALLKVPYEDVKIKTFKKENFLDYYKKDFYYSLLILIEEITKERRLAARAIVKLYWVVGNLFIDERMLHCFLAYVLVPMSGNYAQITDKKMQLLLYVILNKIHDN